MKYPYIALVEWYWLGKPQHSKDTCLIATLYTTECHCDGLCSWVHCFVSHHFSTLSI